MCAVLKTQPVWLDPSNVREGHQNVDVCRQFAESLVRLDSGQLTLVIHSVYLLETCGIWTVVEGLPLSSLFQPYPGNLLVLTQAHGDNQRVATAQLAIIVDKSDREVAEIGEGVKLVVRLFGNEDFDVAFEMTL